MRGNDDPLTGRRSGGAPIPFAVPERLEVVDSTNRYLADLAGSGLAGGIEVPPGYAVVAERQSAGRGRRGRHWEAPAGSAVLCSILLRPDLSAERLHLAVWAVALGAVQACAETAGVEPRLKWPNDLVVSAGAGRPGADERKLAGMLSEVLPAPAGGGPSLGSDRGGCGVVVVGIGINVNWPPGWPPVDSQDGELASIARRGTALNRVTGGPIDRDALARAPAPEHGSLERPARHTSGPSDRFLRISPTLRHDRPRGACRARRRGPSQARPSTSTMRHASSSPRVHASAPSPPATSFTFAEPGSAGGPLTSGGPRREPPSREPPGRRLACGDHATSRHRRCRFHRFELRALLGGTSIPTTDLVVLDALTYAGNRPNLAELEAAGRGRASCRATSATSRSSRQLLRDESIDDGRQLRGRVAQQPGDPRSGPVLPHERARDPGAVRRLPPRRRRTLPPHLHL